VKQVIFLREQHLELLNIMKHGSVEIKIRSNDPMICFHDLQENGRLNHQASIILVLQPRQEPIKILG